MKILCFPFCSWQLLAEGELLFSAQSAVPVLCSSFPCSCVGTVPMKLMWVTKVFTTNRNIVLKREQIGGFPEQKVWLKMHVVRRCAWGGLIMKQNEEVRGAVCILEGVKNPERALALIIWPEVYHFFADSFSKNKQNIEKIRFLLILFFFSKTTFTGRLLWRSKHCICVFFWITRWSWC